MAKSGPTQLPAFFSSNADFESWVTGVHNALAAVGLVQTADTGQINPATVALPGAINTSAGYEIWRFSDALQATLPIFIKVEYGTGSVVNRPSFWITVGSATNGAGTLSGALSTRQQLGAATSKTAGATLPLYVCAGSGYMHLSSSSENATNSTLFFGVERTRDASGATTADGYILLSAVSGGSAYSQAVSSGGVTSNGGTGAPLLPPTSNASRSSVGSDVGVGVGVYFLGKPFYTLMTAVAAADISGGASFVATVLGTAHTYLAILGGSTMTGLAYGASGNAPAMVWE
jgi:hypothetical protein